MFVVAKDSPINNSLNKYIDHRKINFYTLYQKMNITDNDNKPVVFSQFLMSEIFNTALTDIQRVFQDYLVTQYSHNHFNYLTYTLQRLLLCITRKSLHITSYDDYSIVYPSKDSKKQSGILIHSISKSHDIFHDIWTQIPNYKQITETDIDHGVCSRSVILSNINDMYLSLEKTIQTICTKINKYKEYNYENSNVLLHYVQQDLIQNMRKRLQQIYLLVLYTTNLKQLFDQGYNDLENILTTKTISHVNLFNMPTITEKFDTIKTSNRYDFVLIPEYNINNNNITWTTDNSTIQSILPNIFVCTTTDGTHHNILAILDYFKSYYSSISYEEFYKYDEILRECLKQEYKLKNLVETLSSMLLMLNTNRQHIKEIKDKKSLGDYDNIIKVFKIQKKRFNTLNDEDNNSLSTKTFYYDIYTTFIVNIIKGIQHELSLHGVFRENTIAKSLSINEDLGNTVQSRNIIGNVLKPYELLLSCSICMSTDLINYYAFYLIYYSLIKNM